MTNQTIQITSPEFSIWENQHSADASVTNPQEVYQLITDPHSPLVGKTTSIQIVYNNNGGGKKGRKAIVKLKAALLVVAFSATGDRKVVEKPSGLICIDIDDLGPKLEEVLGFLRSCQYVALAFISPSGVGLKGVFRIPVIAGEDQMQIRAHFKIAFMAVAKFIFEHTGVEADAACSDVMRLCYLAHDPGAYLNEQAVEFPVDFTAGAPSTHTASRRIQIAGNNTEPTQIEIVRALLFSIAPRPTYEIWLRICAAVRNALGNDELAIALLKEWSPEEVEGEYTRLLESPFDEIGLGTLRHYAAENDFYGVWNRFFYHQKLGGYFLRWGDDQCVYLKNESQALAHYWEFVGNYPSQCPMCKVRIYNAIDYAGEVAGYRPGVIHTNGRKILITRGPQIIPAQEGRDWCFLRGFFASLFETDQGVNQQAAFFAWLTHCRRALLSETRRQTPALALVGARGNGKSLALSIIKQCLGGRSASAYKYLSGQTNFNADLFAAELLVVDDEAISRDHRSRLQFAQNLKNLLFAETVRLEAKGHDAFSLAPIQAVAMAVNNDPQHIRVLPEIDETMRDKIILIETASAVIPDELRGHPSRLQEVISQELPGFLHFIDNNDIESFYEAGRLSCIWNPQVVDALGILSPEMQLLNMIVETPKLAATYRPGGVVPEFTAIEVVSALHENDGTRNSAHKLTPHLCGIYLGKLCNIADSGISLGSKTTKGRIQKYKIDIEID